MPEVRFVVFLICLIIFTLLDKSLTYTNLKLIEKNFPDVDKTKAEKNLLNRYLFNKFGLSAGTVIMFFVSIILTTLAWLWFGNVYPSKQNILLYVIFIIYGVTIVNNIYFLLKYSRVIL